MNKYSCKSHATSFWGKQNNCLFLQFKTYKITLQSNLSALQSLPTYNHITSKFWCLSTLCKIYYLWSKLIWFSRLPCAAKAFWQNSHLNGFSPVCVLTCTAKPPVWVKRLPHNLHSYFLIWRCTCLWWFLKYDSWANDFSQIVHLYGFEVAWTIACILSSPFLRKAFWHMAQL